MNTTKQLIEQLEKESGKRVTLKEKVKPYIPFNTISLTLEVDSEDLEYFLDQRNIYYESANLGEKLKQCLNRFGKDIITLCKRLKINVIENKIINVEEFPWVWEAIVEKSSEAEELIKQLNLLYEKGRYSFSIKNGDSCSEFKYEAKEKEKTYNDMRKRAAEMKAAREAYAKKV